MTIQATARPRFERCIVCGHIYDISVTPRCTRSHAAEAPQKQASGASPPSRRSWLAIAIGIVGLCAVAPLVAMWQGILPLPRGIREDDIINPARRELRPLSPAEELVLNPGDAFTECPGCPEMVLIPAGEFMMGSTELPDEKPPHRVTIDRAFAVGKFEVTFEEWEACVADGGCADNKDPSDQGWGRGQRPVINISWNDAKEFERWLSRRTGKNYRLLTEAEWEYAARAGTSSRYAIGDVITRKQAHFSDDGWGAAGMTMKAGAFQANAFGLYDTHGNVWEWVQDCYAADYAKAAPDGKAVSEPANCSRVLRGGSWVNGPEFLRSAFRLKVRPDLRTDYIGFRLARILR